MYDIGFWIIQGPGWVLVAYLVVAQCLPVFSYDLGERMGTQEPAGNITRVGVAFFKGLAWADLLFYTPVLALGLWGHAAGAGWSAVLLAAGLGITVYWPVACLVTVRDARGAPGWDLPKENQYWVVLPAIALWALASLGILLANT